MSTHLIRQTPSDVTDAEMRDCAAMLGWDVPRFLHEMTRRYWRCIDGTEEDGPVPVMATILDMTEFATQKEAESAAARFDPYAAQARREGKTKAAFRTTAIG